MAIMLNVKLPARIESRLSSAAERTGKTPDALTKAALEIYLQELEDYLEVQEIKKNGMKTISLSALGKRIGLES